MDNDLFALLNQYAAEHSEKETPLLHRINRETHLELYQSNMLSGHLQGRLLSLISRLLHPKTIIEIGTFTGYSALCLAEGLQENGILHTIEINDELSDRCTSYFNTSAYKDNIKLHIGDALDILPKIAAPVDLVFIDADKPNYSNYFDLVIDKVRPGGFILADNVLYHGQVLLPEKEQSKNGQSIADFNQKITSDKSVKPLLLPLRDGLFILEKM